MAEYRDIEGSRHESYKYFPIRKPVKLYFETDSKTVYLNGYTQENDPGIFSKNEETTITVVCPDPWFYELSEDTVVFSGIDPMFEFPFSNESLYEKLIIFGEIRDSIVETFTYRGDIEVGFVAEIEVHQVPEHPINRIRIMNLDKREVLEIDTNRVNTISGGPLRFGDVMFVSTIPGDKYAHLIRGGEEIDILNAVTKESDWPKIYEGENTFGYMATVGTEDLLFKITFQVAYGGL